MVFPVERKPFFFHVERCQKKKEQFFRCLFWFDFGMCCVIFFSKIRLGSDARNAPVSLFPEHRNPEPEIRLGRKEKNEPTLAAIGPCRCVFF